MVKEIFMPKLSSTMEVGTLLQWYKHVGDVVEVGDPLFEIMTDKINIEVESYEEGVLLATLYEVDDQIPVNQIIGYIGESGEMIPEKQESTVSEIVEDGLTESQINQSELPYANEKIRATPAARKMAREYDVNLDAIQGSGPLGRIQKKDIEHVKKASPLAQKVAKDLGVNLNDVRGSGFSEKVMKSDVDSFASKSVTSKKLSGMRKTIAQRMSQSAFTAPHVTLHTDVDMSELKKLRENILPVVEDQTGHRISYTDFLVKFISKTLERHPVLNATIENDVVTYHNDKNIGLAVAVETGLIVPVIHQVQHMGLADITTISKELGMRAKNNQLTTEDFKTSTFTISNLGNYEINSFTPIINTPEVAILGVGRIKDQPVVVNQSIEIRPIMVLSLSFDHRVIDGAPAAAFLTDLKKIIENPYGLLI